MLFVDIHKFSQRKNKDTSGTRRQGKEREWLGGGGCIVHGPVSVTFYFLKEMSEARNELLKGKKTQVQNGVTWAKSS